MWKLLAAVAASSLLLADASGAAEIKVLASGAVKEAYLELLPDFEKSSGHKVVTTWSGSADIKKRITAGEVYDLVIIPGPEIDAFIEQGKMVPGSRVDLMKAGIGVAVRAGALKPDIGSSDALKKTLLAARTIGISTGPSGVYIASLFERLGIADQAKPKVRQTPSGVQIATIVASGEAEIGFQQISEFIHFAGVDYVGPLPDELQQITAFAAGIHSAANNPEAARALVEFLHTPASATVIKHHGMQPG